MTVVMTNVAIYPSHHWIRFAILIFETLQKKFPLVYAGAN